MSSSTAPAEAHQANVRLTLLPAAAALTGVVAIQLPAHWGVLAAHGALANLAPLALPAAIALLAALRRGLPVLLAVLLACVGLATIAAASPQVGRWLPLACHLAISWGLAWLFGRTLLRGREALVTRMARQVHGSLPARIFTYTRNVTRAWTLFLGAMGVVSFVLFLFAASPVWSMFANLLLLPLVVLMFLAEYGYRILRYRWFSHATLAQSIGAFYRLRDGGPRDARLP